MTAVSHTMQYHSAVQAKHLCLRKSLGCCRGPRRLGRDIPLRLLLSKHPRFDHSRSLIHAHLVGRASSLLCCIGRRWTCRICTRCSSSLFSAWDAIQARHWTLPPKEPWMAVWEVDLAAIGVEFNSGDAIEEISPRSQTDPSSINS